MKGTFKAKLIETTNRKVQKYIDRIGECAISKNKFLMEQDEENFFLTSEIEGIIKSGSEIFIETKNSTYTLEIIEEEEK
jgi:hypothetical protein